MYISCLGFCHHPYSPRVPLNLLDAEMSIYSGPSGLVIKKHIRELLRLKNAQMTATQAQYVYPVSASASRCRVCGFHRVW